MLQNNMNFYKRNTFFIIFLQIFIIATILLTRPDTIKQDDKGRHFTGMIVNDTTEYMAEPVKRSADDKNKIHLEDEAAPKTVNFILYLIYRLTFKNAN